MNSSVGGRETEDKSMHTEDKNKREEVKTKGAHLGKFCQGVLRANMIMQSQTREDWHDRGTRGY